jgi:hypothetical protein
VVCNSSNTNWKGGGCQGGARASLMTKIHQNEHQNIIFDVMSEVQKDLEDISARKDFFKKSDK